MKNTILNKSILKFSILLSVSFSINNAGAQESGDGGGTPYSFGGACSSQGSWTQSALMATQNLKKITAQLKDDANCKALGLSVTAAIESMQNNIKSASDSPDDIAKLSHLPTEISALRSYAGMNPAKRSSVLKLMMDKAIQGASISSKVKSRENTASGLMDFGTRLRTSTNAGIGMLNQVMDNIPRLNECMIGENSAAMGSFIAMSTQVAAAFASSGQDGMASKLALTISKITNLQRDIKFSKTMRKLNQQEFLSSMACLMEVTSESFCQARDAMGLFKQGMNNLSVNTDRLKNITKNNPFAGFYILNTHVPNVTRWLQQVQIGVDPKLPNDATFQNNILNEIAIYQKSVKTLLGDYNYSKGTLDSLSSKQAKQNTVRKLVISLSGTMSSGFGEGDNTRNFFTTNQTSMAIPFNLLGMPIPDQVLGKVMPQQSPEMWLEANMTNLPIFNDPDALMTGIGMRMRVLVHEANIASIEYFNRWFIVDKASLVNESVIDIQYTVKDSLIAIQTYLGLLQERLAATGGDTSIIPTVLDTRYRIQVILDKYEVVAKVGVEMKGMNPRQITDVAMLTKPLEAYEDLINTVYEQFNVQLARSGYLANRMSNFVNEDYILLVRNKVNFTQAQQDLFYAVGMSSLEKMLQIYNGNPANVQTDLNMALKINKGNIEALETLLKDSVVNAIAEAKMVAEGKTNTGWDSVKRVVSNAIEKNKKLPLYGLGWGMGENIISELYEHADRYTFNSADEVRSPESEFDDSRGVYAQLCIQALAFPNQQGLRDLCAGAVLESPLKKSGGLGVSYDQRLNSYLENLSPQQRRLSLSKRTSFNHSERICALRDYNRQNMVLFMTLGKNSSNAP